ncbi:helix-turn-helix domain-containing protein [Cellulomonas humilata]|uniref:helix-turn-helix domain-containing protein n=1 Tax=Cellulomonas humilata TaxID=144055 RepID=UPI001B357730
MTTSTVTLPPLDHDSVAVVGRLLSHVPSARLVGPDGESVALPSEVHDVLIEVVAAMEAGQAITVAPVSQVLTTSQAAELLGVSRPTLVKMLDQHLIPYDRPNRHRRLRLADVLAFRQDRSSQRRATLAEMTRQAVADGAYAESADDYVTALADERRSAPYDVA